MSLFVTVVLVVIANIAISNAASQRNVPALPPVVRPKNVPALPPIIPPKGIAALPPVVRP